MVGTAVYQVGLASSSQAKNWRALKPGVQNTLAPALRVDNTAAIRPWMWNSGITFRQTSSGVSARVVRMLRADARTFPCVSGTIFGLEVVPDVCRTRATSSLPAGPPAATGAARSEARPNSPAGVPSRTPSSSTGMPSAAAASSAGEALPRSTTSALAPRSSR